MPLIKALGCLGRRQGHAAKVGATREVLTGWEHRHTERRGCGGQPEGRRLSTASPDDCHAGLEDGGEIGDHHQQVSASGVERFDPAGHPVVGQLGELQGLLLLIAFRRISSSLPLWVWAFVAGGGCLRSV
jgi:hypothetical protein